MAVKVQKLKSDEVVSALRLLHPDPEWAFIPELRVGTGYRLEGRLPVVKRDGKWVREKQPNEAEQRLDAWALNCWPSKDFAAVAYEVKVTRQDFLQEIKQPQKRELALRFSNRFYFAAPAGLIKPSELPPECGLVEVVAGLAAVVVEVPPRPMEAPPIRFLAAVARRAGRSLKTPAEVKGLETRLDEAVNAARSSRALIWSREQQLLELARFVREFLDLTGWIHTEQGLIRPGESSRQGLDEANALRAELERLGRPLRFISESLALPDPLVLDDRYRVFLRAGKSFEEPLGEMRELVYQGGVHDLAELVTFLVRNLLLDGSRLASRDPAWVSALLADELLRLNGFRFGRVEPVMEAYRTLLESSAHPTQAAVSAFRTAVISGGSQRTLEKRLPALRETLANLA